MDLSAFLGLATSGAGLLSGRFRKGASAEAWQKAAETYGLLLRPATFWKGPKLSGSLFGNELTVDIKDRNTASAATRFRLDMPSLNLGLKLRKKGFWNSLRPRLITGDRAFDRQVVIEGRNSLAVQDFLTPERRKAVQGFLGSFKGAAISDNEISFKIRGDVKKADDMVGAIAAMTQVASILADDPQTISGKQREVAPAAVTAIAAATAASAGLEWPETRAVEPDQPDDLEAESTTSSDSVVTEESTPGVEEFCATVFAPGALSFAANQKFKQSYEGERIVWTGTLESMSPFTFDFDFGSGRGIKAVLTILESDAAGARNVQAVIGLPPDAQGLEDRVGRPVTFAGRLLKVDGLAKRVTIADAELRP